MLPQEHVYKKRASPLRRVYLGLSTPNGILSAWIPGGIFASPRKQMTPGCQTPQSYREDTPPRCNRYISIRGARSSLPPHAQSHLPIPQSSPSQLPWTQDSLEDRKPTPSSETYKKGSPTCLVSQNSPRRPCHAAACLSICPWH